MSDVRPVWLTEGQRDYLDRLPSNDTLYAIVEAWDAAPADATEALDPNLRHVLPEALMEPGTRKQIALLMLRALGMPDA